MVKIAEIRATAHSCPITQNVIRLGLGRNVKRDFVCVRVITDDGTVGYGEAHHGQNLTAMAEIVEKGLGSLLIGEDPFDTEGIWNRIKYQQIQTHGLGAGSVIALSGIDIALWDLKGKLLGQPIWRLLGGSRKSVRAYAGGLTLGFQPLKSLEAEVASYVDMGYSAIKLRVGDTPRKDAERVTHIRKTFGDDLDIAVDAATRYSALDLPEVVDYLERNRVYWMEEPFTPDNVQAYVDLSKRTNTPIAAGENHYTRQAFTEFFSSRAITICQADICKTGGITELKKIADMAAAWHIAVAPHTSHSIIATAATVNLMGAIPNALIYEADEAPINPFRTDLSPNAPKIVDGFIQPNDAPGLGIDIDETVLEKYPPVPGPCYIPG
jgi:D-galactarolactone cycloisomerase